LEWFVLDHEAAKGRCSMVRDEECATCGSVTVDGKDARVRLSDYLKRAAGVSDPDEADRRADEIMTVLGGGGAFALRAAGALAANWWLFALRGLLAVVFGVLTLAQPLAALAAFVLLFGVWAFIDGIDALALAVSGWRSWQLVLVGLVGVGAGVFTFFRPGITAIGLYAAVAGWSIARGILEIGLAIELRKQVRGELWLVFGGIASILFGVLLIALPLAGLLALAWLIGVYALSFGFIMIGLSLRLRRWGRAAPQAKMPLGRPSLQPA
jgi:uncharacterized membrane protein HdeD (DUF308 family)